MDAIEASMAAVFGGVTGIVGVTFPLPPPPPPLLLLPSRPPPLPPADGLGLVIPLLGGLILFSFWRLSSSENSI
jgi:hypothetical protein